MGNGRGEDLWDLGLVSALYSSQGHPRASLAEPYAPSLLHLLHRLRQPWSPRQWWRWWWLPSCWAPRWPRVSASCARTQVSTSAHRDLRQARPIPAHGEPRVAAIPASGTGPSLDKPPLGPQQPPGGAPAPGQHAATPTAPQPTSPFQRPHLPARPQDPRLAALSPKGPSEVGKCVRVCVRVCRCKVWPIAGGGM